MGDDEFLDSGREAPLKPIKTKQDSYYDLFNKSKNIDFLNPG